MIVALTSGKCNLIVTDIPTAKAAAFANPELTVLNFEEEKGFKTSREDVEIGIAVKKGNTELVKAMDAVLEKMTAADFDKMMDEAIKKQPLAQNSYRLCLKGRQLCRPLFSFFTVLFFCELRDICAIINNSVLSINYVRWRNL